MSYSNSFIENVADPTPAPGREPPTLPERFLAAGVAPEVVGRAVEIAEDYALARTAEGLRQVVRRVGGRVGLALNRAILGDDGRSLAEDAAGVGIRKQSLAESQKRIERRLLRGKP